MLFTHKSLYAKPSLRWSQVWQTLTHPFHNLFSDEPKIKVYRDSQGNVEWHIYDPLSDRNIWVSTEAEVYTWLESRYHGARHS